MSSMIAELHARTRRACLQTAAASVKVYAGAMKGHSPAVQIRRSYGCQKTQALLPEKRMLFQPNLAKAAGSDFVQRRVEELRPCAHVFGHTHFSWDATYSGVRYVQWPLAYPQERQCALLIPCLMHAAARHETLQQLHWHGCFRAAVSTCMFQQRGYTVCTAEEGMLSCGGERAAVLHCSGLQQHALHCAWALKQDCP